MSSDTPSSQCKVILAANIAKNLLDEVSKDIKNLKEPPLLVGFLASSDPAARTYAEWTGKTCKEK